MLDLNCTKEHGLKVLNDTDNLKVIKKAKHVRKHKLVKNHSKSRSENEKNGIHTIKSKDTVSVRKINLGLSYQRAIEPSRFKKIEASIKQYGYWPHEVIVVNQDYIVIDGQHRYIAAKNMGINTIPITVMFFPDDKTEADFFVAANSWNTKLNPTNFWWARNVAGHPMAVILYALNSDPASSLYEKIALKGSDTKKNRFSINDVLIFIHAAHKGYVLHWTIRHDPTFTNAIRNTSYTSILASVNSLVYWFFECFTENKKDNPLPYRQQSIQAILGVYCAIIKQNKANTPGKYHSIVNKMKSYIFTNEFIKTDLTGKKLVLISHINKGKSDKNKIKFST